MNRTEKRILVVDDEPKIVELIAGWFVKKGYQIESASDGIEALEKLRASHFDLVMTDIMMPRMDGVQLLKEIQSDPALSGVPVFLLGARAEDRDDTTPAWAKEMGAAGGLGKPFSVGWLCDRIDRILFEEPGKP